ncbi:MAG: hypothetical protein Q7S73_01350 [bacterium]|jgi:hypothetical protein|nr:hypothetical protein [bacterium]
MTSPEQIPLPEQNKKEDPLAKLRGLLEKKSELVREELKKESMSMKKMEKFKDSLLGLDLDGFIKMFSLDSGQKRDEKPEEYEMDDFQKQAELENSIREFLDAKDDLDSESKRKLWDQIYKENWLKALEHSFQELQYELETLELLKKSKTMEKGELVPLTENEEKLLRYSDPDSINKTKTVKRLTAGLQALKSFKFDERRLKELEDRFKKVKK